MINDLDVVQWAYLLDPTVQLVNTAGKPLTDGYIEVYIAGTRNKYYCASDFDGTLHPFQIPLDSLGSNIILANPENAYDVYVYNRFGSLVMSRYNVTPADGGAVISNTERINDLEELVVSAVTGLQGQIDDINEALDGKKDKQEEYSVTLTPTQTVSAIIQNENGEIEVIYQEIDLPEQVPNVDIVSPASTINITTHIDEETNTKTFSIDLSDLGHLEYGQFMATNIVETGANMYRIKGNLGTTMDGKIQLHKGNSYHITVRGYYTCNDLTNTSDTLNYIEYSSFTSMPVNVDNTVAGPQYFEISYDIFKLSTDTNYYIAFASSAGKVSNLTVEIHSLSNISILAPESYYQEGWGIDIVSSVISVDPTILNDYSTHTEVYEATVTAIQAATSVVPEVEQSDWDEDDPEAQSYIKNKPDLDIYATHDEVYESSVSSIQLVTGLIPDVSDFATHTEVYDSSVTAIQLVTGLIPDVSDFTTHNEVYEAVVTGVQLATSMIPEQLEAGQYISIEDNTINVTGLQPEGDYATNTEVSEAIVTAIQVATGAIPDPLEAGQYVSIENNVITVTGLQEVGDYVTHDELTEAVTGIEQDLDGKKDKQEVVEFEGSTTKTITKIIQNDNGVVSAVYEDIEMQNVLEAGQYVSIVNDVITVTGLQPEGDYATNTEVSEAIVTAIETVTAMIPDAQIQSDWNQSDNTQPDYIKNKPDLDQYATDTEVSEAIVTAIETVTALIPAAQVQSDWTEDDTTEPSYIQNKPEEYELVAGNNIAIDVQGATVIISSTTGPITGFATEAEVYNATVTAVQTATGLIPDVSDFATNTDVYNATVTAIETVTALIPEAQVQSNWTEDNSSDPSYIQNKPNELNLVAGNGIHIGLADNDIVISAVASGYVTEAEVSEAIATATNDMATQTWVNNQGFLTSVPDTYATDAEVSQAIASSVTGFATKLELSTVESTIPTVQLNSNDQVTAINNHEIAGTGGSTYTAGDYISIDNDEISVTGICNLVAGNNITITESGNDITISAAGGGSSTYTAGQYISIDSNDVISVTGLQVAGSYATTSDISDMATKTWVGNQGYLTSVPSNYATDTEVSQAIASSVTDFVTESQVTALIPESEEVEFEELDITQFAQASAIPTIQLNSNDQVTAINNHEIAGTGGGGGTTYTAGQYVSINNNNVIAVTGLEPLPDSEEVDFEELNLANYALVSAIPDTSDMATKTWVGNQGYLQPSIYRATKYDSGSSLYNGTGVSFGNATAKIKLNLSNILSSYTVNNWCIMSSRIQSSPEIWEVRLSAILTDVIGTQWTYVNNAVTVTSGHICTGPHLFPCFAEWGDPVIQIVTDSDWTTSMNAVIRNVRNSSGADNNALHINLTLWWYNL